MTEPFFTIITVARHNAKALRLTGKSLAMQMDAASYEWLVIGAAEEIEPQAVFIPDPGGTVYQAMNAGIDAATGKYLWFLQLGDTLSDGYVLRDLAREIKGQLAPDFVYGDVREQGLLKRALDFEKFSYGMITAFQGMLVRRETVGELRFDPQYSYAADYAFTLKFQERAHRIHHSARILCDLALTIPSTELLQEKFRIRAELLQMPQWKNKAARRAEQFAAKFPKLYKKLRYARR